MQEDQSIVALITNYHEFNRTSVDELQHQPSPLAFLRHVAKNRPFVIRQGAKEWKAVEWTGDKLRTIMDQRKVKVAITPQGNADAVVEDEQGNLLFVEPYEVDEPFADFLGYVQEDSRSSDAVSGPTRNVKYAQTQNDNLRSEYLPLYSEVPDDIDFASQALNKEPDAINFWLGNARSTTSLHKDNYENIYVQIRGQKHFTMLPPIEMPCVNETPLPFARYRPVSGDEEELQVHANEESEPIPVPIWDPDENTRPTAYSKYSKAMRLTLNEGDMMYLPAMWYHKVQQSNGEEGFACSVNYWYDMDFEGSFWSSNAFLRDITNAAARLVPYPDLTMQQESASTA